MTEPTASAFAVDPLITETADRLFGELCTHEAIQQAEANGAAPEIWSAFAETGFPWISIAEAAGGSGGSLLDALEVLRLVGFHAAPVPAAETGIIGGWMLAEAGLALPEGIVTVAPGAKGDTVSLDTASLDGTKLTARLGMVPWGRAAERLVLLVDDPTAGPHIVSVAVEHATVEERSSLAGEPRDCLTFDAAPADIAPAPTSVTPESVRLRGALSRVALIGGAVEKMSQLTVTYANERKQFGQAIARFQAVQQHLVWAAQDAALARSVAEIAGLAASRGPAEFEIASAKINANQAATRATKACHQAHGAMGMTQEYPLHHYSRRLWAWRTEYGGTSEWSRVVGQAVAAGGADQLYPLISGRA